MAVLSDNVRQQISNGLQRYWSSLFEPISGMTKSDVRDAVNATDDYINSIQADYNNALPAAAKANLTAAQKTIVFCAVALARVSIPFLKRIFGDVD